MLSRGPRTTRGGRSGAVRWAAIVAAVAEVALVVSVGAFAHPGSPTLTAALAVDSPSVDGSIKPANEWADAGSLSIPFPGHPATLSIKHKNDVLYVLLTVQDDPSLRSDPVLLGDDLLRQQPQRGERARSGCDGVRPRESGDATCS